MPRSYRLNVTFYMLLRASGSDVTFHPCTARIVKLRKLLEASKALQTQAMGEHLQLEGGAESGASDEEEESEAEAMASAGSEPDEEDGEAQPQPRKLSEKAEPREGKTKAGKKAASRKRQPSSPEPVPAPSVSGISLEVR